MDATELFIRQVVDWYLDQPHMPMLISPAEFRVVERWACLGMAVEVVVEELRESLARRRASDVRWRPRSLAYFTPALEERAHQLAEWRAIGHPGQV